MKKVRGNIAIFSRIKKIVYQAKGGKRLDTGDEPEEVASTIVITNGVSKEKTPDATLTYEEELCLRLQDEARLFH